MADDDTIVHRARTEIAALLRLRDRLRDISRTQGHDTRHDLVVARRDLADHLPALDAALGDVVALLAQDHLDRYRDMFSRFRHRLALHQASWPAVRITEDIEAYTLSANQARAAETELLDWIDALIAQGKRPIS